MVSLKFELYTRGEVLPLDVSVNRLFAIGYAGRDMEKTKEHIDELERELGVPAPNRIPTIFELSPQLISFDSKQSFVGDKTSGEVEYVLVATGGDLYVGLGSDHTDRGLEAVSVLKSKQICTKPMANQLWKVDEVVDHWDQIELRSWQNVDGKEKLYQSGKLSDILPHDHILEELDARVGDIGDSVIFSGTVPLLGSFEYGSKFRYEMVDPITGRRISSAYDISTISEDEK